METLKLYFGSMGWNNFWLFIFWNIAFIVTNTTLNFWLKAEAEGGHTPFFSYLNEYYNYDF
jgi:ABC-type multidrug transport system fused ATPase/permease subunit